MADTKDKWIRAVAESQNTFSNAQRDVKNAKQFANQKFAKSLLTVADNLNLAIDNVSEEKLEKNEDLKVLFDGVKMTLKSRSRVPSLVITHCPYGLTVRRNRHDVMRGNFSQVEGYFHQHTCNMCL